MALKLVHVGIFAFFGVALGWVPPGLSEREVSGNSHVEEVEEVEELPPGHANHHDHHDNIDLADLVLDTEHILDDLDIYTKKELESMDVDEKVFTWFSAHDWDLDEHLDGLEMLKALSHNHNYHHPSEEGIPATDTLHDPAQHTEAADRARFARTEKLVDKMLEEDDSNKDGLLSFPEFMSAYHAGRLDGLKLRKTKGDK